MWLKPKRQNCPVDVIVDSVLFLLLVLLYIGLSTTKHTCDYLKACDEICLFCLLKYIYLYTWDFRPIVFLDPEDLLIKLLTKEAWFKGNYNPVPSTVHEKGYFIILIWFIIKPVFTVIPCETLNYLLMVQGLIWPT